MTAAILVAGCTGLWLFKNIDRIAGYLNSVSWHKVFKALKSFAWDVTVNGAKVAKYLTVATAKVTMSLTVATAKVAKYLVVTTAKLVACFARNTWNVMMWVGWDALRVGQRAPTGYYPFA